MSHHAKTQWEVSRWSMSGHRLALINSVYFYILVATLKGSGPLEQDTCGEPIKLKMMFHTGAEMNPARSFTPAVFKRNFINHGLYWVGPMICGAMGAVMYDFMLFPSLCGLAERVATLKGSGPLEQEPIKLKTQALYCNPATKPGDAVASQNCYSSPLLPATQLFSSQQSSSPPPSNTALLCLTVYDSVCMYALV
ncbi:aquaporin-6-like [Engraulis encrasicolus]|uniref:aquaporin-6-like n=1 Tax=Engraulis encrasicolus TaxID=184585 RepID=UPI002FD038DE